MPRKAQPWFRVYVEMIGDLKVRRLDMTQRWVWVAVLAAAGESPTRGSLYVAPGLPMTVGELAEFAGVKEREAERAIERMQRLHMVTVDGDGLIVVTNWGKRQYESDNVTARTRTHRERSKERSNAVPGNGPETEAETEVERGLGEERPVTLRPAPATDPTPKHQPATPSDERCIAHQGVADPGPCNGCRAARERAERIAERDADKARREHETAVRNCPDCEGTHFVLDDAKRPTRRKCQHPNIRKTA